MVLAGFCLTPLFAFNSMAADGTCHDPSFGTPDRGYITCVQLTDTTLQSFEYDTKAQVQKIMEEPGRPSDDDGTGLHYDSDDPNWGGVVNFSFSQGKVSLISAIVTTADGDNLDFIWNQNQGFSCSDLPGGGTPCNGPNAAPMPFPEGNSQ